MIEIDRDKCTACGSCVKDCIVHVLSKDAEGRPIVRPDDAQYCINCQHCLAICSQGAVTCHGVSVDRTRPLESVLDGRAAAALIRQRRSIRQWRDEPIPAEVWSRLVDCLAWMPTGCNDHRLHFTLIRDLDKMNYLRCEMSKTIQRFIRTGIPRLLYPGYRRYMDEIMHGNDIIFRNAPAMIVAATPKNAPCREADPWIALSYFDLLAHANGLGTCWSGFAVHAFKMIGRLRRELKLPKGYEVGAVLLLGLPSVSYSRTTAPEPVSVAVL